LVVAGTRSTTGKKRRPTQAGVARYLGFDFSEKKRTGKKERDGPTTEFQRIVRAVGYKDHKTILALLALGPLPTHLAQAARWYIGTYHTELTTAQWPPQCFWEA